MISFVQLRQFGVVLNKLVIVIETHTHDDRAKHDVHLAVRSDGYAVRQFLVRYDLASRVYFFGNKNVMLNRAPQSGPPSGLTA
jgi:hypothetical protein